MQYTPTIGLEIHAELKTATKMFCACTNAPHAADPNTYICAICMGHPGTLPAPNERAVESVVKVGIALQGTIATYSEFDRKNYFYPDIPKGYQISQFAYPIVSGGTLNGVSITRVHLEEDTARSLHDQGEGTAVDYNRAGVPLMELVTEPVIHSAEEASAFAKELQLLLRTLGVSGANMERGEMRVEANISVGKDGVLGTKVEVKNLNSFKAVEAAIKFEVARHIKEIEEGGSIIQETRGWDEAKGRTFSQRKKESSHDYRYFPDPDIPKLNLTAGDAFDISRINEMMPILPSNKRIILANLGLPRNQIEVLVTTEMVGAFFDSVAQMTTDSETLLLTSNYLTSDVLGAMAADAALELKLDNAGPFAILMGMLSRKEVTSRVAKDILRQVAFEGKQPKAIIESLGLGKRDADELIRVVDTIIDEHSGVFEEYRRGKESVLQFLVGQGMRATKGSADPGELARLFKERIG